MNNSRKYLSLICSVTNFQRNRIGAVRSLCGNFNRSFVHKKVPKFGKMGCNSSKVEISSSCSTKQTDTPKNTDDDYIEAIVCAETDINENELKTFDLGEDGQVLLVKQKGSIKALGTKCTHYGAPLVSGALGDGRVRCQWHGACFNINTGDIEDFPGMDSLPCYQVTVTSEGVKVRAKREELKANKRVKTMVLGDSRDAQNIVVIGGGPAGAMCVETLRQENYTGNITLVCKETHLPYDRVKVSKALDSDITKLQFRNDDFYKNHRINVLKNTEAIALDVYNKTVSLSNGSSLTYDKLFVATGSKAARPSQIPGTDLKNVFVLRDYDDGAAVHKLLSEDKEVVVLGSSFIGMEAASYCVNKVKKVTLIARDNAPFKPLLGEKIGLAFMKLFQDKGINFTMHSGITNINANSDNEVESVTLKDGTILKADILILGTGSTFYTDFMKNSGMELRPDGSVEVNEYLESNGPGVYVGGDIAHAPVWSHNNEKSTIGHWGLAHYHGKVAALNMLGKKQALRAVPYFWTMLFGKSIRYCGHGKYDDILHEGDVDGLKFVAYYLNGDEVVAVSSCTRDPVVSQFGELLAQGKKLYRKDVEALDASVWTKKVVE